MKSNFAFAHSSNRFPSKQSIFERSIHLKTRWRKRRSSTTLLLLNELLDSDDEKPTRGSTRDWVKRRREKGYFNNIVKELRLEDRVGFREMFRMDVSDFENVLAKISDLTVI